MKKGKKFTRAIAAALSLALAVTIAAPMDASATNLNSNNRGAEKLWMAIKQITGVSTIMDTGAHPDDERNSLLAYCLLEKGAETVAVITTYGQGGQNAIGSESGFAYSAVRARELQEAMDLIGGELVVISEEYDNTAVDFGFSKLGEEALAIWDVEEQIERTVRAIRTYRPDVVFNSANNVLTEHGQHQATNIITAEAFKRAADPNAYPDQIKAGLRPYQPKKLYDTGKADDYTAKMDYTMYNEILGLTYEQFGQNSRYFHISQSMGKVTDVSATAASYHKLIATSLEKKLTDKEEDMFDGIELTYTDLAAKYHKNKQVYRLLNSLQDDADDIVAAYPINSKVTSAAHDMIDDINKGLDTIKKSNLSEEDKYDLTFRLNTKLDQLYEVSAQSSSLIATITPASYEVARGQSTKVTVQLYNGGKSDLKNLSVKLNTPEGWTVSAPKVTTASKIDYNKTIKFEYEVSIPKNADYYHPYEEIPMTATVSYVVDGVASKTTIEPKKLFAVMPEYSLQLSPENYVLNTTVANSTIPVTVGVKSYVTGKTSTTVTLDAPAGWTVEPKQVKLEFTGNNQNKTANFTITPPANLKDENRYTIKAKATSAKMVSDQTVQVISYDHIGTTYYLYDAAVTVQSAKVILPEGLKVGYFDSGKDEVYKYLEQIGMDVTVIGDNDVMYGDLSKFDTIVLGIRAYRDSEALITANNRLLDFVEKGGNLVVNYSQNSAADKWQPSFAPYPLKIGSPTLTWRVVEEDAKMTILDPNNKVFSTPNKIVESDWDGWVQERSIYNISEADPKYTKLVSAIDKGSEIVQDGQWLTTNYGKGVYTYTSIVWYRQIQQAMAPGAYRMFVNILSQKQ